MHTTALVLTCLACAGLGRRVQTPESSNAPSSTNALTNFLLANQPGAGWQTMGSPSQSMKSGAVVGQRAGPAKMGPLRDAVLSEGLYEETNLEFWDPLNFAGQVSDEALMWFRNAEIKHGRVSMLAVVGYLFGANGITFGGDISYGKTFASINADGVYNAWDNVPTNGKLQIFLAILILELVGEGAKPHYMRGGVPGKVPGFKGFLGGQDARLAKAEMKHGRLAMFGIISFLVNHNIPGAVPFLPEGF